MVFEVILVILIATLLYKWILSLLDNLPDVSKMTVFITGCDSGFGQDLALKCLRHDMTVFAGCLTDKGIKELEDYIPLLPSGILHPIKIDVTTDESVIEAKNKIEKILEGKGLDGLVNNAGIVGEIGFDDWLTLDSYKAALEVNLFGVIRVTHAFKELIKMNKGRIVNVASVMGIVSISGLAPYSISKYGINAFSNAIRTEYKQFGVTVSTLEPGFFKTPLASPENNKIRIQKQWEKLPEAVKNEYGDEFFNKTSQTTHDLLDLICSPSTYLVVDAYFHALTSKFPKARYPVGWDYYFVFYPFSLMPTYLQDTFITIVFKIRGIPRPQRMII
ncbi:unnamed protein product [Bursaphelenchus okinawaensis]|uniref:Uncharacterized protein n=1 Tax=Bursaphelenchus okinawaensis TaxID=465554 RepID=A0A811LIW5_9BILA|nr:unnamed protein product [Bursaphelenchus okinawaensis]CAG9126912.1 unnamed protein product [Bursaphelenchus okinawaensis]